MQLFEDYEAFFAQLRRVIVESRVAFEFFEIQNFASEIPPDQDVDIRIHILLVGVGVVLTLLARAAVMRATSLTIEIEPRWILIALAVGLFGGSIGALYPALRAARQDAVEALSYE